MDSPRPTIQRIAEEALVIARRALGKAPAPVNPGGANTDVQFNDSGTFGGSPNFTFNKTTRSVTTGAASTATGTDALASGAGAIASANNGVALGGGQATNINDIAIGNGTAGPCVASGGSATAFGEGCNSTNAASIAGGEECNAEGINSVCLGFANTVGPSATFGVCVGDFVDATASSTSCRGANASSIRVGQDSHSSGQAGAQGRSSMDLHGVPNGAPAALVVADASAATWHGEQNAVYYMRVEVLATTLDGEESAGEVRYLLIAVDGFGSRVLMQEQVTESLAPQPIIQGGATVIPGGLGSHNWALTITPSGNDLVFTADPSAQQVDFIARLTWQEWYNLIAATLNPTTLALNDYFRDYAGSPWTGTASAGTSGADSATEAVNPPTIGAGLNGHPTAIFDGVDDQLTLGHVLNQAVTQNAGSGWALLWIHAISNNGATFSNPALISTTPSGYYCVEFLNTSPATVQFSIFDATAATVSCFRTIPIDAGATSFPVLVTWEHDGANIRIGVNEFPGASGGSSVAPAAGINAAGLASVIRMGTNTNQAFFLNGQVEEFSMAPSVFTNVTFEEVRQYVNARYRLNI
jgi:hypothetical protein